MSDTAKDLADRCYDIARDPQHFDPRNEIRWHIEKALEARDLGQYVTAARAVSAIFRKNLEDFDADIVTIEAELMKRAAKP